MSGGKKGKIMDETKSIYQSLTIKAVFTLLAIVLTKFGYDVTQNTAGLADVAEAVATAIFTALAFYGRLRATKRIGK